MSNDIDEMPLNFGKYRGKTPNEVSDINPSYVVWMYANVKPARCSKELAEACEQDVRELDDEAHHDMMDEYWRKD